LVEAWPSEFPMIRKTLWSRVMKKKFFFNQNDECNDSFHTKKRRSLHEKTEAPGHSGNISHGS
jgi:hypothetical protein